MCEEWASEGRRDVDIPCWWPSTTTTRSTTTLRSSIATSRRGGGEVTGRVHARKLYLASLFRCFDETDYSPAQDRPYEAVRLHVPRNVRERVVGDGKSVGEGVSESGEMKEAGQSGETKQTSQSGETNQASQSGEMKQTSQNGEMNPTNEATTQQPDGRTCTLKNTLRNGLVIGALESRYDHQVGEKGVCDVDQVQGRGAAGPEAQPDGGELRRADGGEAGGHAGGARNHQS